MLENAAGIVNSRPGQTLILDKNYFGRAFEEELTERELTMPRPVRRARHAAPGSTDPA